MSGPSPVADRVPVAPLREAFLASGLTLSEVCYRLGWTRRQNGREFADTSRLARRLGMRHEPHPGRYINHRIGYEHAARIAEAIGMDPVEMGL